MKLQWVYRFAGALLVVSASLSQAMTAEEYAEEYQKELQRAEIASQTKANNAPSKIVDDPGCSSAWNSSSAALSCTITDYIEQKPAGTCVIRASCMKVSYQTRSLPDWMVSVPVASWQYDQKQRSAVFFPASYGYTKDLVNCDGELKYFSC